MVWWILYHQPKKWKEQMQIIARFPRLKPIVPRSFKETDAFFQAVEKGRNDHTVWSEKNAKRAVYLPPFRMRYFRRPLLFQNPFKELFHFIKRNNIRFIIQIRMVRIRNNHQLFVFSSQLFECVFAEIPAMSLSSVNHHNGGSDRIAVGQNRLRNQRQSGRFVPMAVGIDRTFMEAQRRFVIMKVILIRNQILWLL